ncbi:MAG TPA: sulfotransferase [Cyanobacteria bacterium UBA11162]|nr:sulfotransferase [Cyanobacteria bacterium UBA11162]
MKMPNFIIIGAGKSGTTSLYKYLQEHPQIFIPSMKEVYFFAFEGQSHPIGITNFKDYQALFQEASEEQVIGEVSSIYLFRPQAPERIKYYLPDVKLIAILRNPADRAFSDYLMNLNRHNLSKSDKNSKPMRDFAELVKEKHYFIQIGFYYEQLKRYYDRFDPSQIKVYLYEDLVTDARGLVRDIFRFVGVDDSFVPDTSQKHKVSGLPKNQAMHRLLTKSSPMRSLAISILKPLMPAQLRQYIRDKIIDGLVKQNLTRPQLSSALRQELIEIYREDILNLQNLINRDLSTWLDG